MKIDNIIAESKHKCPHCGGPVVEYSELMEKKDACYYKVKASSKVWPSAYASGRLVQCRKKGAGNYGKKNESVAEAANAAQQAAIAIAKKKKAGVKEAFNPAQQKPLMAVALDKWKQSVLNRYPEARFATQKMINGATIATDRSGQVGVYDPKNSYAKVGPETQQPVSEGMPADNDMGATPSGAKMTLGQWKQMWMKKMPNADFAAMFRSPPNMRGSAIAYFDGWMNNPDARWDPQQGVAEEQLGEIGDTPAGRAALGAVQNRAYGTMDAWSANPTSGYSSTPKDVRKATSAAVAAGNRLHGFGPDNSRENTVMARDALRQKQALRQTQGVAEVDMNRRGFLKGLGAAAVAGAAGGAMAQSQLPMSGLPDVEKVDLHKMIITLNGQEYPLIKLSPTDIRPRGGQQVRIACAQMGERCLGHYNALLAGGRVFVLPGTRIDSTQPATNTAPARIDSPSGTHDFSKEFLQQASNPNRTGRYMISVERAQELLKQMQEGMTEGFNGEYDDEAGMADNNLETLARAVEGIDDLIQSGDNLPEWCQEKIAVAKSMLVAVWDYMASEEDSDEVDPEVDEMFEAMDQLAEQLAAKHRVSADTVWESFEALDDRMLYETAAWRRKEGKSKSGGLNAKGVASYRRENPGSKLQTAVTTKPSKLKPGSKAAKRRKSFCARMSGVKGPMKKPNGKPTRKALALRKWNC